MGATWLALRVARAERERAGPRATSAQGDMTPMLSKRLAAAALVSLGLVLGACGAAEEEGGGTEPAPKTDEPAASTEPAKEEAPAQVTFVCNACKKTKSGPADSAAPMC